MRFANGAPHVKVFEVDGVLRPCKGRKPRPSSGSLRSTLSSDDACALAIMRAVSLAREIGESTEIGEWYGGERSVPPKVPTGAAPMAKGRPERWLVDTGSGHDLVARDSVSPAILKTIRAAEFPLVLNTANGPTDVTKVVCLRVESR